MVFLGECISSRRRGFWNVIIVEPKALLAESLRLTDFSIMTLLHLTDATFELIQQISSKLSILDFICLERVFRCVKSSLDDGVFRRLYLKKEAMFLECNYCQAESLRLTDLSIMTLLHVTDANFELIKHVASKVSIHDFMCLESVCRRARASL